jgi:formylglycine-generating enzyme required for sulfatase activity
VATSSRVMRDVPRMPAPPAGATTTPAASVESTSSPAESAEIATDAEGDVAGDAAEIDLANLPTVLDPVVELIRRARADLANGRLSQPPNNNAFQRFSLALKIDPTAKLARDGVRATAQAYLDLADKALAQGAYGDFAADLALAGQVAGSLDADGADLVAAAAARRAKEIEALLASAQTATADWDGTKARAAYEAVLELDGDNAAAKKGLKAIERIGQPGYAFRDRLGSGTGPEMVVVDPRWAVSRTPITRGAFARWWAAAGRAQFAGREPSCRDRESIFRSSRNRSWREPGFAQDDGHPVVCVSFDEAAAYAAWLGRETGNIYRLPTPAEWERLARQTRAANCDTANLADASYKKQFETDSGQECNDGYGATSPVGKFPAAGGLLDVDGNVREWVASCGRAGALAAGCRDHGVRGRGWMSLPDREPVAAVDSYVRDTALNTLGFRVVRDIRARP